MILAEIINNRLTGNTLTYAGGVIPQNYELLKDSEYEALIKERDIRDKLRIVEAFEAFEYYVYSTLSETNPVESSFNAIFQLKSLGGMQPEADTLIQAFINFRTMVYLKWNEYEQQILQGQDPVIDYTMIPKPDIKFRYFKYLSGLEAPPLGWAVPDVSFYLQ